MVILEGMLREGMLCLLIKKEGGELISSEFTTFVEVIAVEEKRPELPPILVKVVGGKFDTRCETEELIPLVEHFTGEKLQDILQEENHQIVKNFAMMIHDLQKQNKTLLDQIGSLQEGLEKTQKHLRKHESKPH